MVWVLVTWQHFDALGFHLASIHCSENKQKENTEEGELVGGLANETPFTLMRSSCWYATMSWLWLTKVVQPQQPHLSNLNILQKGKGLNWDVADVCPQQKMEPGRKH